VVAVALELNHVVVVERAVLEREHLALATFDKLLGRLDERLFNGQRRGLRIATVGEGEKAREPGALLAISVRRVGNVIRTGADGMSVSWTRVGVGVGIMALTSGSIDGGDGGRCARARGGRGSGVIVDERQVEMMQVVVIRERAGVGRVG
jgi:hypothetical protein